MAPAFKRKRTQASVGSLKEVVDCSYNDFPAALGIIGHGNISFILMGFLQQLLDSLITSVHHPTDPNKVTHCLEGGNIQWKTSFPQTEDIC